MTPTAAHDGVLHIGVVPSRTDIIASIAGVVLEQVVAAERCFMLDGCRIPIIGRDALLRNERAAGESQDLADVAALEALSPWPDEQAQP